MALRIHYKFTIALLTLVLLISLVPAILTTAYADPTTIYVNADTGDDLAGDGSQANPYQSFYKGYSMASDTEIDTLDLTGTFTWTDGIELGDEAGKGFVIAKSIIIQGHGAGNTIIQAASTYGTADRRIFTCGTYGTVYTVTFQGLELRYGCQDDSSGYDTGALSLSYGIFTISQCYIHDNLASEKSAINSYNAVNVTIENTTISNNECTESPGDYGAVNISTTNDIMTEFVMTNSTICYNYTASAADAPDWGGGLYLDNGGNATLTNCTIAYNYASVSGGGISIESGTLYLKNTIVASNTAGADPTTADLEHYTSGDRIATIIDNGNNIIEYENSVSLMTSATTWIGEQPALGLDTTLALNSATNGVPTLALLDGSIAIGAGSPGNNYIIIVPMTDERLFARDASIDIGAFEYGALPSATPPTVTSINRQSPVSETTNATGITYRVTFSEDVTGVDTADFTLTKTGTATGTIASVSAVGNSVYDVTVNTISGDGTLRLDLNSSGTGIVDMESTAIETGYTSGQTYTIDNTAPTVTSVVRQSPTAAATNATNVTYRVTFSEAVTGVDTTDFTLTKTSTATGTVASVSAVSDSVYDVTVNTISGDGTLRMDLNSSITDIEDEAGNSISGGYTGGEPYTIDQTAPSMISAVRSSDTQIIVTLSEDGQNLSKSNDGGFTVTKTGDSTAYAVTATAQGTDASHIVLTVDTTQTAGAAGLTITYTAGGNGTVADTAGNLLATDSTGVTIAAWDTTAPTVSSINRMTPSTESTTEATVTYLVTFSETVTGIDTLDFQLYKTGSVDASIGSVSASGGSTVEVQITGITGVGTLRLDLDTSQASITDLGGISLAGSIEYGQTYTIDRTAPTIESASRSSDTQIIVTLNEDCQNLVHSNDGGFTVTKTGDSTAYAVSATAQGVDESHIVLTVADMATAGASGVTVTYTAGGNGTVADTAGNLLATDSTGVAIAAWDTTAPTVTGVSRYTPLTETISVTSVTYRVTFSETVTGVDTADFILTATGTASGSVSAVSATSGTAIDVTVNTISGAGTLRLDVSSSGTGIADAGGTALSTGYTSGETYTIDQSLPVLISALRNSNTQITVVLSEACQNLMKANDGGFTVTKTGDTQSYAVSATAQGNDESHIVLTVADMVSAGSAGVTVTYTASGNGTIQDTAGNVMATNATGISIGAWDTDEPMITGATRDSNTQITLTVSEACLNVTKPNDGGFTVTMNGSAKTFAVTSVAEGSIILTVEDMSAAGTAGVTVSYTAGGNGTITDLAGNPLASATVAAVIDSWDTSAPQTGDSARLLLWMGLVLCSGAALGYGAHRWTSIVKAIRK